MEEINKPQICVVGIGEVLIDKIVKNKSNEDKQQLGGAPAIFAYHAAKSHCNGVIVSAIGLDKDGNADEVGKIIQNELQSNGLSNKYIYPVKGKPSGTVIVDNSDVENPSYTIQTDVAWSRIPYTDELKELARNTKAVYYGVLASYVSGTTKNTIDKFLHDVPNDCLKIFDVNIRRNPDKNGKYTKALYSKKIILEYLRNCTVLKVNNEELEFLCRILQIKGGDVEKCYSIMDLYQKIEIMIVTMGRYGSSIYWHPNKGSKEIAHSSLSMPVNLKNTVGAGDALAGAFIGLFLRGKTHVAAHQYAARRSEIVCEAENSMPAVSQYDIFISYAHEDKGVVAEVFCKLFEALGFKIWRDTTNTECGDVFTDEIKQAIKNSEAVVFFSSHYSNDSTYVAQEIKCAVDNKKPVIPIKMDDSPYQGNIGALLNNIDYLDLNRFISSLNNKVYGNQRNKE